jgi:signal transduction histidine kinase
MGTAANIWQGQILLVDDDPILLELGSAGLRSAGFHVDVATDGQNALDLLSHFAHDLVITDLEMPRMDGLELIKRIRSNIATESLPVIVITGLDIACTLDSAYLAGATSFMTKPINWPTFAHHARYVLRSSRQQAELRAVRDSIDSASRIKSNILSSAAHEFRNPLAIIDATAQRLMSLADKNQLTSEEVVQRVEKIRASVQRMTRLIERALTAARMDQGIIPIEFGPCNVEMIVSEVCARQQELAGDHVFSCDLAGLPEIIQADASSLEQVFTNLLSNAVKYSPDAPNIEIFAYTQDRHVAISVRDHGIGIDEEDLHRIGERFFRTKTSSNIPGTGIGLNLVKMLVEEHDGTVNVESVKGEGSTFTIRLPISGPDLSQQADAKVA